MCRLKSEKKKHINDGEVEQRIISSGTEKGPEKYKGIFINKGI